MPVRRYFLVALLALALLVAGCNTKPSSPAAGTGAKIKVAATIMPLADMVSQIGGNRVQVITLLPPGSSPHTFEITAPQMKDLAGATLLVQVGGGLDEWAGKFAAAAGPELQIINLGQGLVAPGANPHIWLDPILVRDQLAPKVAGALVALDPEHKDYFETNLKKWQQQLTALDREIQAGLAPFAGYAFIEFHPAWFYFARRYHLQELASVEEKPGQEPSAAELANIVQTARSKGKPPVFIEPQFNPQAARTLAAEYGGRVLTLDPLGGGPGAPTTYIDLMRRNLETMIEAFR
ncbi:metal ABC transporter substrate-binding protein [Neomoorella thermoacetica]|uniref:metal ABC transporter substrate-binding protein n=1 Tax=Neomoorella thermoacetica TaxID=1525 RepID=UPI0008FA0892|nr:metal ABC transporter substrate-binding protein [Moorella thermoacetica]OIQ11296.1 high-affinity zinc uptake system binding-protein ZnuA precursor [Moorella thermoacetica]